MSNARTKRLNESDKPVINFGIADDLHKLIIPANTTTNLAQITPQEVASLAYDTTLNQVVVNNGSGFSAVGAGGSGTVTNVATGTGLSGGPITTSGTIALANTAVSPGSYTNSNLTIDQQGRITSAANGTAGTVTSVATGTGLTGGPITSSGTVALANTAVSPGSYTSANITVDQQGRLTAAANGSAGASTSLNNLITTAINQSLLPDGGFNLGSAANQWNDGYIGTLRDGSGIRSVGPSNRALFTSSNLQVLSWNNQILQDPSGNTCLEWTNRRLFDSSGVLSLEWSNRNLYASDGTTIKLNWSGPDINASTNKIVNVTDPTSAQDAATKNYVDTKVTGASGSFTTVDSKTVTVVNGLITSIV